MKEFYHYTLESNLPGIRAAGIYPNHPYFTTSEYFNTYEAGQHLGVRKNYIDCVLKFNDDGLFKRCADVPNTGRFDGGGNQYLHPYRPKPIAIRKITERQWKSLL